MDIEKLHGILDTLGCTGNTLSTEQWVTLNNSLTILQADNHFKDIYFWGIIQGQEADYFIAYGYERDALFQHWGLMPGSNENTRLLASLCFQRFQGDPALVVEILDDDPGLSPDEIEKKRLDICMAGGDPAEIMQENKMEVSQLKEEDRLAATIDMINREAAVIPRGVLMKEPDGFVVINNAFEGLSAEECEDLKSYVHYRKPIQKWNTNLITRKDYNYALDFLDTIDLDIPAGCWSIQEQKGGRLYTLKNLYWPGFFAYHWTNTKDWGYVYNGSGLKNLDVPFMVFS